MISILGISAFYHDSAAALIIDGKIHPAFFKASFEPTIEVCYAHYGLRSQLGSKHQLNRMSSTVEVITIHGS